MTRLMSILLIKNIYCHNVSTTVIAILCTIFLPLKEPVKITIGIKIKNRRFATFKSLEIRPFRGGFKCTSLNRFKKYLLCHLTFRQKYTRCPSSPHARGFTLQMRRISNEMKRDRSVRIHDDAVIPLINVRIHIIKIFFIYLILKNLR